MKAIFFLLVIFFTTLASPHGGPLPSKRGVVNLSTGEFSSQKQEPQSERIQDPRWHPFDEFGAINYSDMMARIDNFAIELQNAPEAKGFIVVFPRPDKFPAWPLKRAYWCKGYLTKARGLDASRIEVVNGGFADEIKYQLWITPPGVELPVAPFDLAAALAREKTPLLYDRAVFENYPPPPPGEGGEYEDYLSDRDAYEPFVSALRADPALRGFIVAYATRRNARGTDRKIAAREKLSILKLHAVGADRLVAVGGGLRKHRTIEYWLVPPGSPLPKPTPTVRPARRRRR